MLTSGAAVPSFAPQMLAPNARKSGERRSILRRVWTCLARPGDDDGGTDRRGQTRMGPPALFRLCSR